MVLLARVGDCLALLGFLVGLSLWHRIGKPRRMLVAFLGLSACAGLGQAYLRSMGMGSAWFGNLWDLSILVVLIPALMMIMRERLRRVIRPLLVSAVVCWVVINLVFQELGNFSDVASAGFYLLLSAAGLLLLSQSLDEPLGLRQKPGFIRGVVCLSIGLIDALTTVTLSRPGALSHGNLVAIMSIRNAAWCGAYLLLSYTLILKGRHDAAKRSLHTRGNGFQLNGPPSQSGQFPERRADSGAHEALSDTSGARQGVAW